jgi:hypothetical protein
MGALDLIRKGAAKGAKKVAPFFSKVDEVLDSLPRNKGTGDEFLREIEKTKGVKPAEIQDRGIAKALKGKPKMTKAEVQKIFESNPPPRVQEKVLTSEVTDYDEWLEAKAQEIYGVDWFELRKDEKAALNKMFNELPLTQYDKYKTPGGENYREILLKLPVNTTNAKILEAGTNKTSGKPFVSFEFNGERYVVEKTPGETDQQAVSRRIGGMPERGKVSGSDTYISSHYKTDPNLLAHIRVQDFTTPEGKKVLLVDEIQSDWHQEGRKKGYKSDPSARHLELQNKIDSGNFVSDDLNELDALRKIEGDIGGSSRVPDAPFKKNWHELAMKRVLDYAAENGYDSIAITPGAEQAKRYDLSKQIDAIEWNPEKGRLYAKQKNSSNFDKMADDVTPENLADYIGKEAAEKLIAQPYAGSYKQLNGVELEVGGEGMKGFYDKILPDYLNNFGKQYGAQVGSTKLMVEPQKATFPMPPPGQERVQVLIPAEFMDAHSFDITPQLRDEVKAKGLPMYGKVATPALEGLAAGTGAATIGSEVFDTNNEQQVQNPVHFTENPDAMLLELMQRN